MNSHYSKNNDFLRIVSEKVKQKFDSEKHNFPQLDMFFMFIPFLTLSFINNQIVAKERLLKKSFLGGYISDDGFMMGLSYMLQLCSQVHRFNVISFTKKLNRRFIGSRKLLKN